MPGPPPKPAAIRQRRNKTSTRALLAVGGPEIEAPDLPVRAREVKDKEGKLVRVDVIPWHGLTLQWWRDVWASPMAGEFLKADVHGLFVLAQLIDDYWVTPLPELAAEIRLQRQSFGLTPLDRRRLQWEIERSEQATEAGVKRKQQMAEARRASMKAVDPRTTLFKATKAAGKKK